MFESCLYRRYKENGLDALNKKQKDKLRAFTRWFYDLSDRDDRELGRRYSPNPNKKRYTPKYFEALTDKINSDMPLSAEERGILDIVIDYGYRYILPVQIIYQLIWKPERVRYNVNPKVIQYDLEKS